MNIINEMILFLLDSVVCSNEKLVVRKESCYNNWFPETGNWLGMIIKHKDTGDINSGDIFSCHVTDKDIELTIVLIWNTKHATIITLSDFIHFQIFSFDHLTIEISIGVQVVSSDLEFGVIYVQDTKDGLGILCYGDVDDIVLGVDPGSKSELFEKFTVVSLSGIELLKPFESGFVFSLR